MPPATVDLWTTPAWRRSAETWITERLNLAGIAVSGVIEQPRVRMWSTQLTVPTDRGRFWFKVNHPAQAFEAALVEELARLDAGHVLTPVAVDHRRGWLLTAHHGETLHDSGVEDVDTWCRIVAEFGVLQRRVSGHADPLVATGLTAIPPGSAADLLERRVTTMRRLDPGDATHLDTETAARALAGIPHVREAARRLADTGPDLLSLEHNDLHANNVFVPRPDDSTLRFFDFADAVWAHPFTSLAVPIAALRETWRTDERDPRLARVLDSYLDVWSDLGRRRDLRSAVRQAIRLSPIHRFESWRRLGAGMSSSTQPEVGERVRYWLLRATGHGGHTRTHP